MESFIVFLINGTTVTENQQSGIDTIKYKFVIFFLLGRFCFYIV